MTTFFYESCMQWEVTSNPERLRITTGINLHCTGRQEHTQHLVDVLSTPPQKKTPWSKWNTFSKMDPITIHKPHENINIQIFLQALPMRSTHQLCTVFTGRWGRRRPGRPATLPRYKRRCGPMAQELCGDPSAPKVPELRQLLHSPPRKHWSLWEKQISFRGSLLHNLCPFFCGHSSVSSCTSCMLGVKTCKCWKITLVKTVM